MPYREAGAEAAQSTCAAQGSEDPGAQGSEDPVAQRPGDPTGLEFESEVWDPTTYGLFHRPAPT